MNQEKKEIFEHHKFVSDKKQDLIRIDKFLIDRLANSSRNKIQEIINNNYILVNEKPVKPSYKIKPFDEVTVNLPYPVREIKLIPEDIPLTIVYEDDDLMVINKQPNMVVHPSYGHYTGTLVNAVLFHYSKLNDIKTNNQRPGIVHRLDKNTSGLIVVAKNDQAMTHLAEQFASRTVEKEYYALVWGIPKEKKGKIEGYIGRNLKNRKIMHSFENENYGKHAITLYETIENLGYVSLVKCTLKTGRTHQIRVHMKHLGHPLFNDSDYGGDKILRGTTFSKYNAFIKNCFKIIPRQALHSKILGFTHPKKEKKLFFESDLPEDFNLVLKKWKTYTQYKKI